MKIQDRYTWEAENGAGEIVNRGADINGAVRVSMIPAPGTGLPRHDFVGVKFVRRFARNFIRYQIGGFDKDAYIKEVNETMTPHRRAMREYRDRLAAKNGDTYASTKKSTSPAVAKKQQLQDECVQCIVCDTFRAWIRYSDGVVLITPPDSEIYL